MKSARCIECVDHPSHVKYKMEVNENVFEDNPGGLGISYRLSGSVQSSASVRRVMLQSNGSSSIRQPPSTSRRSSWEPRLPAPRRPIRSTWAGHLANVNPSDPDNTRSSPTSTLAPKNASGRVEYVANFQIVTPTDPAQRNGLMIHSVPNRGGNAISTTAMLQGVTYVQSGWQGDLLAQCSPSPAIPYPCFDLNSGPYGSLNTTTGAFTRSFRYLTWRVRGRQDPGELCRTGAGGDERSGQHTHYRAGVRPRVHGHERVRPGRRKCAYEHGAAGHPGSGVCALPAGKHGHEPGSVLDRVLANVQRRDWRKDADPERPVGLGLLPQWLARHAKSQLDLSEDRHVQPQPPV